MKIKWNWGTKITIAIILFVSMILGFVYTATQNPIILVEKDYYPKGLDYQSHINRIKNAVPFKEGMILKQDKEQLFLIIPKTAPDSGTITFYRPNEEKMRDIVEPVSAKKSIDVTFPKERFKMGFYILKILWWQNGKGYFIEKKVFLT